MMRLILAAVLLTAPALAAPVLAQEAEQPSRPAFLQAMGLLEAQSVEISRGGAPFASMTLLQGDGVKPVPRDTSGMSGDIVAAWDFVTEEGRFLESLTITTATVDLADPETRRFALANMLVLSSFPQLAAQFPDARLLAFGPDASGMIDDPDANPASDAETRLDVVQMVGSFKTPDDDRTIVFRHLGAMHPDRVEIVVAIINIDADLMPVRSDAELIDTFAGQSFRTFKLAPDS